MAATIESESGCRWPVIYIVFILEQYHKSLKRETKQKTSCRKETLFL